MAEITEKNPRGAGRKPKTFQRETTMKMLTDTSPRAARYLREVVDRVATPNWAIIDVCKYVINQDLGSPRQRHEHTGADGSPLIPYTELILLAERVEKERLIIIENGVKVDEKEEILIKSEKANILASGRKRLSEGLKKTDSL